jgi:hypothetical protein
VIVQTEINIAFVIQDEDVPAAVRSLHKDLFSAETAGYFPATDTGMGMSAHGS